MTAERDALRPRMEVSVFMQGTGRIWKGEVELFVMSEFLDEDSSSGTPMHS
jgi:hypothetical protein